MGAIAGSWAGLHGPGEKTIEKTGQSGPGLDTWLGVQNRGSGCRAGARGGGLRAGTWGGCFHRCRGGGGRLSSGRVPIPEGLMQGAVRVPTPR